MRAPHLWEAFVLVFGTFRVLRLLSYDDFPPVARARAWVLGEQQVTVGDANARAGLSNDPLQVTVVYRRPTLAHFVHCPFCLGAWISLAVYLAWLTVPTALVYFLAPWALSGIVGVVTRRLDP